MTASTQPWRTVLAAACTSLALATLATGASAQQYPTKPITLVVAYAAGGGTDSTARIFAQALSDEIGQQVVVDNRPGAGGVTGTDTVARAEADGYTLLWAPTSFAAMPAMYQSLPFDITTDFQPVGRVAASPLVLIVNKDVPVTTVAELIAYDKANPGRLNFGSPGVGTSLHLAFELFNDMAGTSIVHVPYQGNGPVYTDLAAGVVQATWSDVGYAAALDDAGPIRPLAITSVDENPALPGIPTVASTGLEGFEVNTWYGLMAPSGIPDEALQALSEAYKRVVSNPDVVARIEEIGFIPVSEEPEDFRAAVATEQETWVRVVEEAGVPRN